MVVFKNMLDKQGDQFQLGLKRIYLFHPKYNRIEKSRLTQHVFEAQITVSIKQMHN